MKLYFCSLQIPQIFYALQTSVQAVLLGAVVDTDWTTQGVSSKSRIETWPLGLPENSQVPDGKNASLAGDGRYLYLHGSFGLIKIGTGYGNTKKVHNTNFFEYCNLTAPLPPFFA